ncbi:MAG: glycoside hydrolase family 125 protein [Marinilabiliales bacterium]|nr:glycoside hydrolase family 125 protein [Marinilabiliales bacterium]
MKNVTSRNFVRTTSLASAGALSQGPFMAKGAGNPEYISGRPAPEARKFTSEAVERTIREVSASIKNPKLAWMFGNCFPNTLDTTVTFRMKGGRPDTFVITGDIPAMWLRDSSAQVWPYLPLAKEDEKLRNMIAGLIHRQSECILIDPFANAFNDGPGKSEWLSDYTKMKPELHERKWEIDSLCYPVRLAFNYWKTTGDSSVFTDRWQLAARTILSTFRDQQKKKGLGSYSFQRMTAVASDTRFGNGYGFPVKPVGLICSAFRPSDDATLYQFLIPSNYFAVVSLQQIARIATEVCKDQQLAADASQLAAEVASALKRFGSGVHPTAGKILAFEVDGYGNALFMDDSNIPSLLTLPYLDAMPVTDPLYQNTRKFILSDDNPWFFRGKNVEGNGGPHVNGGYDYIWPMSLIVRAMTTSNEEEIKKCLKWLIETDAGTGFMHEAFLKDDPTKFTRSWFAWANTLFGELILRIHKERPHLLSEVG